MNVHIKVSNKEPFHIFFLKQFHLNFSNKNCGKDSFVIFWWIRKLKHLESFPLHLQTFHTPLTTSVALISSLSSQVANGISQTI